MQWYILFHTSTYQSTEWTRKQPTKKITNHPILSDKSLLCNGIRNCKFGWDEETCSSGEGGGIPVDFSKTENIVIVLILILIMIGMCTGMIYNLVRKLSEDKEDVLASREKVCFGKILKPASC